jgi:secretion/DNA translocation related CpaE-like protein
MIAGADRLRCLTVVVQSLSAITRHREGAMSTITGSSAAAKPDRTARRGRGNPPVPLVAVIGGCGGAGASTLAVSLAITALSVRKRAILFDADPLGGGLEPLVALGTVALAPEHPIRTTQTWPHGIDPPQPERRPERGRREPDLALVTWGADDGEHIPVAAMRNALRALRGTADLVVVDLPRCIDDSTQLVLSEATHTIVVAPVSERTAVATARLLPRLAVVGPPPQVVARLPSRDELTAREFAQLLGAPLAGIIKPGRSSLPRTGAQQQLGGRSAPSLARFSRRLIERCGVVPATADDSDRARVIA